MKWTKFELIQFWFCGILLAALWGVSIWKFRPQEDPIFFHYNIYFGVDWIGAWYLGYLIPVSALLILAVNGVLIRSIHTKNKTLARIILTWSSIALVFLSISQFIVILLNGNS